MVIDAIVLAGGQGMRFGDAPVPKPLYKIGGQTMLEHALDALDGSGLVGRIMLSMERDVVPRRIQDRVFHIASPGDEIDGSIRNALLELGKPESSVLLGTADTPLVTGEMVRSFVTLSVSSGADLAMPIVERGIYERKFPGSRRHYLKTGSGGEWTLGNMCLVRPDRLDDNAMTLIGVAAGRRKSVLKLAGLLGSRMLIAMLFGRIEVMGAERAISHKMGLRVQAIQTTSPEVAFDVDTPDHADDIKQYFPKATSSR